MGRITEDTAKRIVIKLGGKFCKKTGQTLCCEGPLRVGTREPFILSRLFNTPTAWCLETAVLCDALRDHFTEQGEWRVNKLAKDFCTLLSTQPGYPLQLVTPEDVDDVLLRNGADMSAISPAF
jgi:hypothetical protein